MKKLILETEEKLQLLKQATTKLKIEFERIGTWIWTDKSDKTAKQIEFLEKNNFLYSKGKDKYFVKGSNASDNYGHYNPITYERLQEVYSTQRVYNRNYKKLIPKL